MGVKQLWTLLSPVGRPVLLETMEGKALAIDSSIWIYQFQATMRDKEGRGLNNAHLLGFLRRICKLLFYGIKPVFVFDGGAPALKRSTIVERKRRKAGASLSHAKVAERLLAAQLRREAVSHVKKRQGAHKAATADNVPAGPSKGLLDENTVYLEDVMPSLASSSPQKPKSPEKTAPPSPESPKKYEWRDHDPYKLPDVDLSAKIAAATRDTDEDGFMRNVDPRLATEEELRHFIETMRPEDFDATSPAFRELPTEVQYEIIGDLRLKSRQTSHSRLQKMLKSSKTAMDFSKAQIRGLSDRNRLTQQLLLTTNSMGNEVDHHIMIPVRIAAERNREYVLVKNEGPTGGWSLTIKDQGTKEKPIHVRPDSDDDDDMEEVEINEPVDMGYWLTLYRLQYSSTFDNRRMALASIGKANSPNKASSVKTEPIVQTKVKQPEPLFAPDIDSDHIDDDHIDDDHIDDDMDVNLRVAIEESLEEKEEHDLQDAIRASRTHQGRHEHLQTEGAGPSRSSIGDFPRPDVLPEDSELSLSEDEDSYINIFASTPERPKIRDKTPSMPFTKTEPISSRSEVKIYRAEDGIKQPSSSVHPYDPDSVIIDTSSFFSPSPPPVSLPQGVEKASTTIATHMETPIDSTISSGNAASSATVGTVKNEYVPMMQSATPTRLESHTITPSDKHEMEEDEDDDEDDEDDEDDMIEEDLGFGLDATHPVHVSIEQPKYSLPGSSKHAISDEVEKPKEDDDEEEVFSQWSKSPSPIPIQLDSTTKQGQLEPNNDMDVPEQVDADEEQHWDAAQEMNAQDEEGEFARFLSQMKGKDLDTVRGEIEAEIKELNKAKKAHQRDSEEITQQMVGQIMMLLRLFGIPYITAPMEAEAQCATLLSLGLVEGVITDDSDIFLFGGTRVFKNMFNQSKTVECFLASDLQKELGLDQEKLIRLAYLLGSDYVDGLAGVGPVLAMELLQEFEDDSEVDPLHKFKEWWTKVQSGRDKDLDNNTEFRNRFKKKFRKLHLSGDWPNPAVRDAYYHPTVDESEEPFRWGLPDLDALRTFLGEELRWPQAKVDDLLVPIIKKMGERSRNITANRQGTLNGYFDASGGFGSGTLAPRKRQPFASKRLQQVVSGYRKQKDAARSSTPGKVKGESTIAASRSQESKIPIKSSLENPSKRGKTKAKTASRPRKKRKVEVEEDEEMYESENDESMEEVNLDKDLVPDRPLNVQLRARKGKAASNLIEDSDSE
ncbi:PIN domain-like protein [Serendipita vermifera]|nr:PIN domain-like protein [Serendipita vermifera]